MKQPASRVFHISFATAIILLILLLAFVMPPLAAYRDQQRAPASIPKWGILKPDAHPIFQGKANAPFLIEIARNANEVIDAGSPFTVTASIKVNKASEEIQWDWVVPDSMQVISGELHGTTSNVEKDQVITAQLQLASSNNDNQLIHLHAYEVGGEQPQSSVGHFATRPTTYVYQQNDSSNGNQKVSAESTATEKPMRLMQ